MNYKNKYINIIFISILLVICLFLFCINIGSYPFIDTDETKFAVIAKDMLNYNDWINIKLNGTNIFDMNPLYFWIVNISCFIFGKISTETVRLPFALFSVIGILSFYQIIKNILSKPYAFISTLIMMTCLGILIFSRLATNDILFFTITMLTILNAYSLIFTRKEKTKTRNWLVIFILSAFNLLGCGLFGIFIPFLSILIMLIFSGKLKEEMKLKNMLPGIALFTIICLPWFILMTYKYQFNFIKGYFSVYNFLQYISIKNLFNSIGIFLLGFSPWIFSFLWILGRRIKNIFNSIVSYFNDNSQEKLKEKWKKLKLIDKFISLNSIVFYTTAIFALLYGIKYTFLILFLIFPAACISGNYWYDYIITKKHDKSIFFATIIPNLILIICSLIGLFGHNIINKLIFEGLNHLLIPLIIIFSIIPVISIIAVVLKGRIVPFVSNLILMISLSFVITPSIFNLIALNGGENDLIEFAQKANKDNIKLTTYIQSKKYSLIYYYDKPVTFLDTSSIDILKNYLNNNKNDYIVIEIKDLKKVEDKKISYNLVSSGKRYCLIKYSNINKQNEETKEAEVILL